MGTEGVGILAHSGMGLSQWMNVSGSSERTQTMGGIPPIDSVHDYRWEVRLMLMSRCLQESFPYLRCKLSSSVSDYVLRNTIDPEDMLEQSLSSFLGCGGGL